MTRRAVDRLLILALLAAICLLIARLAPTRAQRLSAAHPEAEARLRAAAARAGVAYPLADVSLHLRKSTRTLTLRAGGVDVATYRVALGRVPEGHKQREGDLRTPEGDYTLCTRNGGSRFHRFMGISYPGPGDADAALRDGRIDRATADRIRATRPGQQPPWKTALGGEVGVHGGGGIAVGDWTLGCVAVENGEIEELWIACPQGTPIRIEP